MNRYQGQRSSEPWHANRTQPSVSRVERTFWVTKQNVFRRLGRKEDECIVASDAELDAKLEMFRALQESCNGLQRTLEKYQERLCNLAQEENAMGRFLKECSKHDQTQAGKAMMAVGKALVYSGQQRMCLRVPLQRLDQEVETFRERAVEDTLATVSAMEKQRTDYRADLSWMKDVSQQLNPDMYKQMERYRKVQCQVRQSKARFDQLKLDCLQKVDLLAAARCNMFSHALTLYLSALLQQARRAARAYNAVAKQIKGYQHYEFSVVPELTEESSKLAKQTGNAEADDDSKEDGYFFDLEYHDEKEEDPEKEEDLEKDFLNSPIKSGSLHNLLSSTDPAPLLPADESLSGQKQKELNKEGSGDLDLLASDCLSQLDDLLSPSMPTSASANDDWMKIFSASNDNESQSVGSALDLDLNLAPPFNISEQGPAGNQASFLPSQLLDQFSSTLEIGTALRPSATGDKLIENANLLSPTKSTNVPGFAVPSTGPVPTPLNLSDNAQSLKTPHSAANMSPQKPVNRKGSNRKDMSAWYDLFADLDPLANPDALANIATDNC